MAGQQRMDSERQALTFLNEEGFSADAIEKQLSHLERNKISTAYNRAEYLSERRDMMQY